MRKGSFRFFIKIYAAILAVVIVIVCVLVWNGLSKYQNSYDTAKEKGQPSLFAEELIENWNYQTVLEYLNEYGIENVSEYNTYEQIASYLAGSNGNITYKESEKTSSAIPVYDIYFNDTRIAVVSIKTDGKNDSHGFHGWKVKEIAFDTDSIKTTNYFIQTDSGCTVTVNGILLEEENAKKSEYTDAVSAKAAQILGYTKGRVLYDLGKCIVVPDIKVLSADGTAKNVSIKDGILNYSDEVSEEFIEATDARVQEICNAYIMNIYSKLEFSKMTEYVENGSEAYHLIEDVQLSIAWGWKPDIVEILEERISDYILYSDTLFSCKYYAKIYKADEDESGEETFSYNMLFKKIGDKWYLNYFVIT